MKGYIKYIVLFFILVGVGIVGINLYSTTKIDAVTDLKTTTKKNEKKQEDKTITNSTNTQTEDNITSNSKTTENSSISTNTNTNNNTSTSKSTNTTSETPTNNSTTNTTSTNIVESDDDYYVLEVYTVDTSNTSISSTNITDDNNNSKTSSSKETTNNQASTSNNNTIEINNNSSNNDNTTNNTSTSSNKTTPDNTNTNTNTTTDNNTPSNTTQSNNTQSNKTTTTNTTVINDGNVIGATGYSAITSGNYLRSSAKTSASTITTLKAGTPFKIISTTANDTWWKVDYNGKIGYVDNSYCMINLPDYIPSITYDISNANASLATSSNIKLSVYGKKLYKTGKVYNERLGRNEYIVPVIYSFAKKILSAQTSALKDGYSLKIYDAYRPTSVAKTLKQSLNQLYNTNSTVRQNINYDTSGNYWGQGWFIAQTLSAHSLGTAIDVTLTKKGSTESLKMPTEYCELSTKSKKYIYGVSGQTKVRNDLYSSNMTTAAKKLDAYMLNTGMTSLASEWWHFQDNTAYNRIKAKEPSGLNFQPTKVVSTK